MIRNVASVLFFITISLPLWAQRNQYSPEGQKTTSVSERLIAWSVQDLNIAVLTDSVRFRYSGTRTSQFNENLLAYNPDFRFPSYRSDLILYDSMISYDFSGGQPMWRTRGYQNDTTIAFERDDYELNLWTCDLQGRITKNQRFYLASGVVLDTLYRTYYFYDALNRLAGDSTEVKTGTGWVMDRKLVYTYDNLNRMNSRTVYQMDNGTWLPSARESRTYAQNGKLQEEVYQEFDGTAWINQGKDSFGYAGNARVYAASFFWTGLIWLKDEIEIRELDTLGRPVLVKTWEVYAPDDTTYLEITHTVHNNPETIYYTRDTVQRLTTYYYEPYNVTDVPGLPDVPGPVLFPNPARDVLYVAGPGSSEGYCIFNAAGVPVRAASGGTYATPLAISLEGLSPGNYFVRLNADRQGRLSGFIKM